MQGARGKGARLHDYGWTYIDGWPEQQQRRVLCPECRRSS